HDRPAGAVRRGGDAGPDRTPSDRGAHRRADDDQAHHGAGARRARSLPDELGPVLYNLYGSTEVAWATIATPEDLRAAPGTVGRPPPHTRLEILDDDGRPLPPGQTGHIFV